ncbi:MAG: hypothetical protein AVDCRST_MAG41-4422 [uncultured Corynebacteriales bacterium]|uniref:Uncharacterized protein n=1 Tax=uncultured Mycobacteriales bacterium TaxID=581187 RepID=A0A6J4JZD0_9ACTN|nr:MAG: hypothetical protein AVDCRST_MAG41-4422 [uncultured Corynebacteriales bacterium]
MAALVAPAGPARARGLRLDLAGGGGGADGTACGTAAHGPAP